MDEHLVRVIVRLSYNRPDHPPLPVSSQLSQFNGQDASAFPLQVFRNSDKQKYIWDVVAKFHGYESGAQGCECLFRFPVSPLLWFLSMAREIPCCPPWRLSSVFALSRASKV